MKLFFWAYFFLKHSFIRDIKDAQPCIDLYREVKAEVLETFEDLPEDSEVFYFI